MIAVIKTGGKQYSVKAGQILKVEKLEGKKGDNISLKNVLSVSDSSSQTIGDPSVKGATVEAKILDQIRDKKIIVFKKRKRQNYRSTHGHRQYLTVLKIESINHDGKKVSATSKIKKEKKQENLQDTKITEKKVASQKKAVKKKMIKKKIVKKTIKKEK